MTLVAGCYERFLFGFTCLDDAGQGGPQMPRSFTHAAHKGVVKSLAAAGPYVASGGADDLIHLYDLKSDKDLGFLMNPGEGAVTALQFFVPPHRYAPSHLLAGCSDGSISVWRAGGGWECMRSLRGHRREVTALAVHPSGRLALSASRDGTLRMWDMVKGRCTFSTKLEGEAEGVAFAPGGGSYMLLCASLLSIHGVGGEGGGVLAALRHPRRVTCAAFGGDGSVVVTGCEDGSLRVWDVAQRLEMLCISRAHATRIKALALPYSPPSSTEARMSARVQAVPALVATASSDGVVKLWALRDAAAAAAAERVDADTAAPGGSGSACLCQAETRARLTVMCAVDPVEVMVERLKKQSEAKQQEQKQRQKNKHASAPPPAAAAAAHGAKRPGSGGVTRKARQAQRPAAETGSAKKPKAAAPAAPAGNSVTVQDGVVSFLDEGDAERQRKKSRQVALNAQRAKGRRKRSRPLGPSE